MPIPIREDYVRDCFVREKFVAPRSCVDVTTFDLLLKNLALLWHSYSMLSIVFIILDGSIYWDV